MKTQTTAPAIGGTSRGRLKATRHFLLPAVFLLGFAALAPTSNAQAKTMYIKNLGNETVKVCVYKAHDSTFQLLPERCWELGPNQKGEWDRNDNSEFHVQLFKPGIIDQHLCHRNNLRGDAFEIEVAARPCTIVARTLTVLRCCNETSKRIWGAFAVWEGENGWTTKSWYGIEAAKCRDLAVTEWDYAGDVYYYVTDDDVSVTWSGDFQFCINWDNGGYSTVRKSDTSSCQAAGQRRIGMAKWTVKPGINTQRFAPR